MDWGAPRAVRQMPSGALGLIETSRPTVIVVYTVTLHTFVRFRSEET